MRKKLHTFLFHLFVYCTARFFLRRFRACRKHCKEFYSNFNRVSTERYRVKKPAPNSQTTNDWSQGWTFGPPDLTFLVMTRRSSKYHERHQTRQHRLRTVLFTSKPQPARYIFLIYLSLDGQIHFKFRAYRRPWREWQHNFEQVSTSMWRVQESAPNRPFIASQEFWGPHI